MLCYRFSRSGSLWLAPARQTLRPVLGYQQMTPGFGTYDELY
mgnify:CR=1 FL=1